MILVFRSRNNSKELLIHMDTEEIKKQISECKILKRFDVEAANERYQALREKINKFIFAYDIQGQWKEHLLKLVEDEL